MHRPAVPGSYVEKVAERTDFSVDDVQIGLRVLHDAVQGRIAEQYRRARDPDSPNHLLVDDASSAWFAFAFADLRAELEAAGYEMDADLLAAVAAVNMTVFQEVHDRTVSFPRDLADVSDTPFFYPVSVEKPDWWREAETRALRALVGLLKSGSSPADSLDAWAVSSAGYDADEWAAVRGVDPDRVRANVETAPEPAPEAADGLRAEARDGVPDGPYDPATDRLFVPTTDQLAAAREASEEVEGDEKVTEATEGDGEANGETEGDGETTEGDDAEVDAAGVDADPDGLTALDPSELDADDLPSDPLAGGSGGGKGTEGPAASAEPSPSSGSAEGDGSVDDDDSDRSANDESEDSDSLIDGAEAFSRAETDDR